VRSDHWNRQTGKTALTIDTIINQNTSFAEGGCKEASVLHLYRYRVTVANIVRVLKQCDVLKYSIVAASTASEAAPLQFLALCRLRYWRALPGQWQARAHHL